MIIVFLRENALTGLVLVSVNPLAHGALSILCILDVCLINLTVSFDTVAFPHSTLNLANYKVTAN